MAELDLKTTGREVDFCDVQGLARFGFGHLAAATYVLFRIADRAAAKRWLGAVPVTTAECLSRPPETAIQVAFSSQGLRALGLPDQVARDFSPEFVEGMSGQVSRSRRLGDIGENSPGKWQWGGPGHEPHGLVMLFGKPQVFAAWADEVLLELRQAGFEIVDCLHTSDLDGIEPFGFRDGISQPEIRWARQEARNGATQLDYSNSMALGELLLGYPNEYGKYTRRPLLRPAAAIQERLSRAEDYPDLLDLGLNGTYVVFRQLRQDVRKFWQFLNEQAGGDAAERERVAALMVGRTREGQPITREADASRSDPSLNNFTYDEDRKGHRCPFGAHIRRANPRTADLPPGSKGFLNGLLSQLGLKHRGLRDDLVASTRFHRLLRRGREYGPGMSPEEAISATAPGNEETGLHFICLNANIARQFEFVQSAWLMGTKFSGMTDESDPVMGNREPIVGCPVTSNFTVPQAKGAAQRITGIPQFVTLRGGGYFFMPGIRALRFLAMADLTQL